MSSVVIMILIAVLIPIVFYWLVSVWMLGNIKRALEKVGLSDRQIKDVFTGKAEFKR